MIESTTDFNAYVGNGAVDTYSYNFKIFLATHLLVTVRDTSDLETTLTIDVDYTVTGAGDTSGGTIVLVAGNLTTDYALVVRRNVELLQEADIRNQGDFFAEIHEDVFDYITMIVQQLLGFINKSLRLPETVTGVSTELPVPAALKWPRWNAAGTALENIDAGDLSVVSTFGPEFGFSSRNLTITIPTRQGVAGGTVDVITTTFSPVIAALANNIDVLVEAVGANATTTPNFAPDGLPAKTIVKGSDTALLVGDIPGANYRMHLVFDASLDKWILLNPASIVDLKSAQTVAGVKTFSSGIIASGGIQTDGSNTLKTKIIDIGDWNMDSVAGINAAHGITFANIRAVSASIRDDAGTNVYDLMIADNVDLTSSGDDPICYGQSATDSKHGLRWDSTNITLFRGAGHPLFDSANFDSTSYNRGWITITYIA